MGTVSGGSNSVIFIFPFLLNRGQLLKERICSSRSKFFPLRVDLILEGHIKQTETYESCSPFVKMAEKSEELPNILSGVPLLCNKHKRDILK